MAAPECEPRIRVAAAIVVSDRLLVVRQAKAGASYHLLPGGGVHGGETLAAALVREVAEETGVRCRVLQPLLINDTIAPDATRHTVNVTFLAMAEGEVQPHSDDPAIEAIEFVDRKRLGELDLRPPLAHALGEAWDAGFTGPSRYLGALWVPES